MNIQQSQKSNKNITEYKFRSFGETLKNDLSDEDKIVNYNFKSLSELKKQKRVEEQDLVESLTKISREKGFNISPIVREHKGFRDRDVQERESRIVEEIDKRFKRIKEHGFAEGHKEGFEEGKKEVYDQTRIAVEEKLEALTNMISEVLTTQESLISNQRKQVYYLIRNLTKWVILRELKDDGKYLVRLLEKLITEMNTKKNLLVRVNKSDFEKMPEVLETIQKKLGKLDNLRVEVDYETTQDGIVLECDNGIINGTFEEQFKSLDHLFHSVGINEEFFKDSNLQDEVSKEDVNKFISSDDKQE